MWTAIADSLASQAWYQERPELAVTLSDWYERVAARDADAGAALHRAAVDGAHHFWRAAAASQFIRETACQETDVVALLLDGDCAPLRFNPDRMRSLCDQHGVENGLRRFRRQFMLQVAWSDAAGVAPLDEVLVALSEFADAALLTALAAARERLQVRYGELHDASGEEVPLQVLCMGKLGGRELNFSSDIDIIFVFARDAVSTGRRQLHAEEYCLREARLVIDILDRPTELGRVFRVDTRLRPFGNAGPLAISLDALEVYLQRHGRDWERYAFIKARLVGRDPNGATQRWIDECLKPFVYRAYLDFGVLQSLRDMQRTIEAEAAGGNAAADIKRGPGGIREIEFIVQSWQLIRGGKAADLRTASLSAALAAARALGCLSEPVTRSLADAYAFLRVLENRLQGLADRQTHRLPDDPQERDALVLAMDYSDWSSLMGALDAQRTSVVAAFRGLVFAGAQEPGSRERAHDWLTADADANREWMAEHGLGERRGLEEVLGAFAQRMSSQPLTQQARERVRDAVGSVIARLSAFDPPDVVLQRALALVEAVCRRSAYLVLLTEQPSALDRLLRLLQSSRFVAEQIVEQPMLLDELLDARLFSEPGEADVMRAELGQRVPIGSDQDVEQQTGELVRFVRTTQFRVAVADVSGLLPVMRVSDRLSDIATVALERTLALAWQELTERHGAPAQTSLEQPGFAIVAYGKLGGLELGYGSDLDLVFLHNLTEGQTDGEQPLEHAVFVMRLARRIVHLLSVQTSHGKLFEVDMRLRPSGRSGLLVSSVSAFERYQQQDAWTWEHQALVRARAVAGDADVMRAFATVRRRTLTESVNRESLRVAVADMRRRMRQSLSRSGPNEFDLKQDPGGIADLEFLVQYLVLQHAKSMPQLVDWTDNIRQLDSLATAGVISPTIASELQEAYTRLRATVHRLSLDGEPPLVPSQALQDVRQLVCRQWQQWLGTH